MKLGGVGQRRAAEFGNLEHDKRFSFMIKRVFLRQWKGRICAGDGAIDAGRRAARATIEVDGDCQIAEQTGPHNAGQGALF